ncbi:MULTISPECIES: calcium-binding protein [unclassified Rhizobium]|uniref:calcium-binding protein n=1 Tax=unclassified Rhizobium TaxID=2613769 RepID=UPI0006F60615|nr:MULTISPECIES: calcium-binding protein [unclassified Rhizobium]KQV33365.1 hypothetical protein ASC86_17500 [Rhizobium sp. Root1212]KRD22499.1 hypothetical protein ASE37_17415 [Rhizobium sp. Root268]
MRSIFRDVSTSDLSADTSSLRGEINSFIDSSTDVASNSGGARHGFDLRDFGNLINGEIRDTFSNWPKKHFSDDSVRKHNHDVETASSLDDATPVKVASATTSTPVETKQAAVTETSVAKAAASAAPATLAATATTTSQTATAAASAASGFPDASNTGIASGTAMTKFTGSYHVTQDNAVISNLEVHGDIVIEAKNVTLKNVKLVSDTPWHALRVMDDATGFTLQDSEIDGAGGTVNAIYGFGTFLRNNLHDVENGINVIGPSLIKDNYIHDMRRSAEAHYDGIEVNGGHDIQILHNTIVNDNDQTSAVMLDNYFGGLSNITVDGNRLVGGGYTVYLDDRFSGGSVDDSSIKITNNQIGGGHYGDFAIYENKPVISGNTDLDTAPPTTPTTPTPPATGTVYTGTSGNDTLPLSGKTNAGNETYKGLAGNDLLKGGAGGDTLDGGDGTDTASYAGSGGVNVNLQTGVASGGHAAGDKFISIENLTGSSYNDTLTGNAAANVLDGGAGADKLAGGAGNDTYIVDNAGDVVTEGSNAGTDTVKASVSHTLAANVENLTLTGTSSINGTGNSAANTITGNASTNSLKGGSGNDYLIGGAGNDTLEGQAGSDKLHGGTGLDKFVFRQSQVKTAGADHITDFSSSDLVVFDVDSGPTGNLAASAFRLGTAALDSNDRFIYDTKAHALYYDSDGNGSAAKVLVATFDNGYNLSASDFLLV